MKKAISVFLTSVLLFVFLTTASAKELSLNNKVYNLVTSFIGDASTSRGFAWTAVDGYEDMVLRYAVSGTDDYKTVTPKVVDKETHLYYKADVTGLTPGTKYTYHIGKTDTDEWYGPFEFTTKPEKVDSFSFVGVADPQMNSEKDVECFKKDISTAIADAPETAFIVSLGDLAGHGYNESLWNMHFESLKGYGESIPYMGVVGNHDVESPVAEFDEQWNQMENFSLHFNHPDNAKDAMATVSPEDMETKEYREMIENIEDTFYSFDYGNAHFSVLNLPVQVPYDGKPTGDMEKFLKMQKDWLDKDLKSTDAKWKIVLFHVGFYKADTRVGNGGGELYFGDIIYRNEVDLVLQGHDHIYMRSHPMKGDFDSAHDTVYTTLGAAGSKRYGTDRTKGPGEHVYVYENTEPEQPVYTVFDVTDKKIVVTAKQTDGTILDKYSILKPGDDSTNIIFDLSKEEEPETTPLPSDWAKESVDTAKNAGITDKSHSYLYQENITREEFCELIYNLITVTENNVDVPTTEKFADTKNRKILTLNALGIINGKSETEFAPKDFLTREEAATIIVRMIDKLFPMAATEMWFEYADINEISDWASSSVQEISNLGFMKGVGDNKFAPKETYTVEQAITTLVRVYNSIKVQN